jgi:hypothetical protein
VVELLRQTQNMFMENTIVAVDAQVNNGN